MWWMCWLLGTAWAEPDLVFVGNSYTLRNELDRTVATLVETTASDPALDAVSTRLAAGGRTFPEHAEALDLRDGYLDAFAVFQDAVILQDQSQIPGFPDTDPAWIASRDAAVTLHEASLDAGAHTLLFQTWGRRDGDALNPDLYPDYVTMQDRITAGYAAYRDAMEAGVPGSEVVVAPVGEAFRAAYDEAAAAGDPLDDASPFVALYAADGSHPSPAGTYLAAAVIAASLTGRPPEGPMVGVPAAQRQALATLAERVVLGGAPQAGDYPWVWTWDGWVDKSGTDVPVQGTWDTPLVLIDGAAGAVSLDTWEIGGSLPGGLGGHGRVEVRDGGSLTVSGDLVVGGEGRGALQVAGGTVEVGQLVAGAGVDGAGRVEVSGGELVSTQGLARGDGVVTTSLTGGTLRTGGTWASDLLARADGAPTLALDARLFVEGDADLAAASLVLDRPDGRLVATGAATLGSVVLQGGVDEGDVLVEAETLDTARLQVDGLAEGLGTEVVQEEARVVLRVVADEGPVDDDTAAPDPAPPADEASGDPEGCGCATGPGPGSLGLIGLGLALARRRRSI